MPQPTIKALLLLALLSSTAAAVDYPLQIIELESRPVEEVIPILKPFISRDGSIAGMRNQLIIRTSAENLAEIRRILAQIDRPPRRLVIHVRQGFTSAQARNGISADIGAMVGRDSKVIVGQPGGDEALRFNVKQAGTESRLEATQRIATLEGRAAFIATGQEIPVREHSTFLGPGVIERRSSIRYEEATTGFYALPRLNGDRVTLEISPHLRKPDPAGGGFQIQSAVTVVSGQLGEWIDIGGTTASGSMDSSAAVSRRYSTHNQDERVIQLMVEEH